MNTKKDRTEIKVKIRDKEENINDLNDFLKEGIEELQAKYGDNAISMKVLKKKRLCDGCDKVIEKGEHFTQKDGWDYCDKCFKEKKFKN